MESRSGTVFRGVSVGGRSPFLGTVPGSGLSFRVEVVFSGSGSGIRSVFSGQYQESVSGVRVRVVMGHIRHGAYRLRISYVRLCLHSFEKSIITKARQKLIDSGPHLHHFLLAHCIFFQIMR